MFTDSEELKKHVKPQIIGLQYTFRDVSVITDEELIRLKRIMLQQMAIKQHHLDEDPETYWVLLIIKKENYDKAHSLLFYLN